MIAKALMGVMAFGLAGCSFVGHRADRREAQSLQTWPPVGQFVEVEGKQVHAFVAGSGPDLVLIHGASGNIRDFTFQFVDRVKDRYRVIVFDRPGLGYSDRATDQDGAFSNTAETPAQQAALLHAAAQKLGVEDEIVLGHSFGGAVAMAWGLNYDPAALVVVSGATIPWEGGLGFQYRFLGSSIGGALAAPLASAYVKQPLIERTIEDIFAPNPVPEGYVDYIGSGLSLTRTAIRANARQVNTLHAQLLDMAPRYETITIPVEILHGRADDTVPPHVHAEPLHNLLPNSNLVLVDNLGHMPHHAAPAFVEAAIDRAAARAELR